MLCFAPVGMTSKNRHGEIQRFWLRQNDEQRRNTEILSFAQDDDPYFIACYRVGNGMKLAAQEGRLPLTSLPVTVESSPVKMGLAGPGPKVRSVWMAWAL